MATLQNIRSKGPLLLIVIGLAMLAFILGDAWKIIRPTQGVQFVGNIAGDDITAMDFQKEVENYTEVVKFQYGMNDLTEEQSAAVRDEVWAIIVRNKILNNEAAALGLTVTDAEVREVIERGTDPVLANTPFSNENGEFDADLLKDFLATYKATTADDLGVEVYDYYTRLYRFWLFVENDIKSGLLYTKYMALLKSSLISNPVSAKMSFDNRIRRADVLMASLPYLSVSDAEANVGSADIKKAYNEYKEALYTYSENRDIYYIDYLIEPSAADRQATLAEINEATTQLEELTEDFGSFVRRAGSEYAYSEVPTSAKNLPEDVVERLDSINSFGVFGPYYYEDDDTYNTFRVLGTANGYDSVQYSMIQVIVDADQAAADKRADSILTAASKRGADFSAIAANYNQTATESWLASDSYETASITGDNAAFINKINSLKKGEVGMVQVAGANLIIKVLDTKTPLKKYDIAIIKRPAEFSEETSNAAYDKLSQFIASNSTIEELQQNVDDTDFRLLYNPGIENYNYNIGGVGRSHEALRWAFDAEEGEISRIFEVGSNNDHLLVVAVSKIHPRGYRSIEDAAQVLSLKALNNKKFDVLKNKMAGLTIDEIKALPEANIDTVQFVNFNNTAYIASMMANEKLLGPSVLNLEKGVLTAPVKGDNCAFVATKISDDEVNAEFDENSEKLRLQTISTTTIPQQVLETLFFEAKIVDNRYKVF